MHEYFAIKCILYTLCFQHVIVDGYRDIPAILVQGNNRQVKEQYAKDNHWPRKGIEDLKLNFNTGSLENELDNPVFVKRHIPHGYKASKYEYDPKLNTLYIPLFRFHVRKPKKQNAKMVNSFIIAILNKGGKPVKRNKSPTIEMTAANIVEDFLKSIKKLNKPDRRNSVASVETATSVPQHLNDAHYPFWKYWTMERPIHVDECPGEQIKVGNMCISHRNK